MLFEGYLFRSLARRAPLPTPRTLPTFSGGADLVRHRLGIIFMSYFDQSREVAECEVERGRRFGPKDPPNHTAFT